MSIDDMLTIAGLSMYQMDRPHDDDAHSPKGHKGKPGTSFVELMKLSPNDWTEGPHGFISLGDMLSRAGLPMGGKEEPPPPLTEPAPSQYMDPPPPPSPSW
eukprot:6495592-Karenia_brevis.AAC.1